MSKVYFASDHAGFVLKKELMPYVKELGHEVIDMGPETPHPDDDYPDFVIPAAQAVAADPTTFGVVIGKSGQGEAMAANRTKGARAIVYYGGSVDMPALARHHNNANILSLGSEFVKIEEAQKVVKT